MLMRLLVHLTLGNKCKKIATMKKYLFLFLSLLIAFFIMSACSNDEEYNEIYTVLPPAWSVE